jgi:putative hemolysin
MEESAWSLVLRLASVLILVLANGFFVAAEFALVAVRRSRVEQLVAEGHPLARVVRRAIDRLDAYLAATQLGITMASIGLGWIGEPALAGLIEPLFAFLPPGWAAASSHALATAIAFAIVTALHIVLGELAPKSLAIQRSEPVALAVAPPLELFYLVFRPAISFLNGMGNLVLRIFGLQPARGEDMVHSPEELELLISESKRAGVLDPEEEALLHRVFDFAELSARELMVPRTAMVAIPINATAEEALRIAEESAHTRFPVYEKDTDHIVGMVHVKDLYRLARLARPFSLREIVRPVLFVPETAQAIDVLQEMKRRHTHLAVVIDEYGGTAGLITLADLIEPIVGEVPGEFEPAERPDFVPQPDGSVLIDGLVLTREVNERFNLDLDEEHYDTIGGFVFGELGRKPEPGDAVLVRGRDGTSTYRLIVEEVEGLRVARVRLVPKAGAAPALPEEAAAS